MKLKLNSETTEFIIIGDKCARESLMQNFSHPASWKFTCTTDEVKNLGVTFDSGNTYASHITKLCWACYCHLKDLRCIWKFLRVESAALLAYSMVISQIDYCNSLLYGVNNIMRLNSKRFKMPIIELSLELIKQTTLLPNFKNYTGSPFPPYLVNSYHFYTTKKHL